MDRDKAFEAWVAGVIYNDQSLSDRGGIPYFLAKAAFLAGWQDAVENREEGKR